MRAKTATKTKRKAAKAGSKKASGKKASARKTLPMRDPLPPGACAVPVGMSFVPVSGSPGIVWFDGMNVCVRPFPANKEGQRLIIPSNGTPDWENV